MVVRFADGTVHPQVRWTNNYPLWIRTPAFLLGDERVMRAYLSHGDKDARKEPLVAPTEYGLYLIDHLTKHIVNASEWSSCLDVGLGSQSHMMFTALIADESFPQAPWNFRHLLENGFLRHQRRRYVSPMSAQMIEPWEDMGPITVPFDRWDEDFYRLHEVAYEERTHQHRVGIDFSRHWTVSSYRIREEPGALQASMGRIEEIGFPLTEADREGWARYGEDH